MEAGGVLSPSWVKVEIGFIRQLVSREKIVEVVKLIRTVDKHPSIQRRNNFTVERAALFEESTPDRLCDRAGCVLGHLKQVEITRVTKQLLLLKQ